MERTIACLDLEKTAESGQCFRWTRERETWRIPHAGFCLYIRPAGEERFFLDCPEEEFETVWRPYFDLDTDYGMINGRIDPKADPFLHSAMKDQYGVRILRQDAWEMTVTSIITQNRNIPAIRRSVELLSRYGGTRKTDRKGREYHVFPTPEQILGISAENLSRCRLGYRERYVRKAAEAVLSGETDPELLKTLPDPECREALLRMCGVGEKVAACIMLFGLHRLNAFPRDVWINRALSEGYPEGFPFERYAPYNGVYQQYLFAGYRKLKTKREP